MNRREQGGSIFREGSDRRRDNPNYENERIYSNQNFGQDEYVTDTSSFRNDDHYRFREPHQVHEPYEERGQQLRQEQIRQQYLQRHERNFSGLGPKGYRRSDQRIEEEVCNVLMRDKNINASEIEVHVENGIVHLLGTVSSRSARFDAEMAVDGIPGVEDIQNDLKVRKWIEFEDRREPSRGKQFRRDLDRDYYS